MRVTRTCEAISGARASAGRSASHRPVSSRSSGVTSQLAVSWDACRSAACWAGTLLKEQSGVIVALFCGLQLV